MTILFRHSLFHVLVLAFLFALSSGCGGGSSDTATVPPPPGNSADDDSNNDDSNDSNDSNDPDDSDDSDNSDDSNDEKAAFACGAEGECPSYAFRVVYAIPSNREPQETGVERMQDFVLEMQDFIAEQMDRQGHGRKTFEYETEADGSTPRVVVVNLDVPDTDLHGDNDELMEAVMNAVEDAGYPLWKEGEITMIMAETHVQGTDGGLVPGTAGVFGGADGHTGVGVFTSEILAGVRNDFLVDERNYEGHTIEDFGPYPVASGTFVGSTFSTMSSRAFGIIMLELGHAFNLYHDHRNDSGFRGNMMGYGHSGWRGYKYPVEFARNIVRLSRNSARIMNYSRFLNNGDTFGDDVEPSASIDAPATVTPQNGLCPISFSASDSGSGLAGAFLLRNHDVAADIELSGNEDSGTFLVYDYEPGRNHLWEVIVTDAQGNHGTAFAYVTCEEGHNRAPEPFVHVEPHVAGAGENVNLTAENSLDPDNVEGAVYVEWDLDGDGVFDTAPSSDLTLTTSYGTAGVYPLAARITDEAGASTVSTPVPIRVTE